MSVPDETRERKGYSTNSRLMFAAYGLVVVCVALIGFALGRLSGLSGASEPVRIETTRPAAKSPSALLVGSVHSDKYHYPWCPGAERINADNRVRFDSIEDARNTGYKAAQNCPGLR